MREEAGTTDLFGPGVSLGRLKSLLTIFGDDEISETRGGVDTRALVEESIKEVDLIEENGKLAEFEAAFGDVKIDFVGGCIRV